MLPEVVLLGWTVCVGIWWLIAFYIVGRTNRNVPSIGTPSSANLTIFKPVPPLDGELPDPLTVAALDSFLTQKSKHSHILVGLHEKDRLAWSNTVGTWRQRHGEEHWRIIWRSTPDQWPNPKIAWQSLLAPEATGEWWMWSDADITAPPGFVANARAEFSAMPARFLTHAYHVTGVSHSAGCLDALFVNVEFLPGVLLLGRGSEIRFGLGAGMLFHRDDFLEKVRWDEMGCRLADDFYLGNTLGPSRLGTDLLETHSGSQTWPDAIRHYLRWQKTVRWCRPVGFAGQIFITPLVGWMALLLVHPVSLCVWIGFTVVVGLESLIAAGISRRAGFTLRTAYWFALPAWSLIRAFGWLACWLPWPVTWGRSSWWGPYKTS